VRTFTPGVHALAGKIWVSTGMKLGASTLGHRQIKNVSRPYAFAYFSHLMISGRVGRFPYIRMPIL
jgi:hypothetical protein